MNYDSNVLPVQKSVKIPLGCVIRTPFLQRNFLDKSVYYVRQIMISVSLTWLYTYT